jgi:sugar phosphate isomerase/epimerase
LRAQAEDCGLKIIGLHWLLAKTTGLMLTSPEETVRRDTAAYIGELAVCCADLGGDILVFGSPAQRRVPSGATRQQAAEWAADTFRRAAPVIEGCGVKLCVEPLSPPEADFINTAAEGEDMLARVGSPAFKLHLDVKAMSTEASPATELIRRHRGSMYHFHANDPNKRGPGFGETDFVPIFRALKEAGYTGWVSVEVFDYTPDPETIARKSIEYMKRCVAQ